MRVHYFQHVSFEGLAAIEDWCNEREASLSVTRFFEDDFVLPETDDFDLLVVMGGPMSVNDDSQYSWLSKEKRFIRNCIEADKPILGICLGAQLIASAMGAKVYPNRVKEIGWFPVKPMDSKTGIKLFPSTLEVFHWHGETFDLPPGSLLLSSSADCLNQAFLLRDRVIGLQFHLEMNPEAIKKIVSNCQHELIAGGSIQTRDEIFYDMERRSEVLTPVLHGILDYLIKN